jgi:hypothetical protein
VLLLVQDRNEHARRDAFGSFAPVHSGQFKRTRRATARAWVTLVSSRPI